MAGTVIEVQGPRTYLVSSQGRTRKVHAHHLLPLKSPDTPGRGTITGDQETRARREPDPGRHRGVHRTGS